MSKEDLISLAKGAAIAAAGAAVAYLSQWASGQDLGVWAPLVTAGAAILANLVRKLAYPTP